MKKTIFLTSTFALASSAYAENIRDISGEPVVSHEKYILKTTTDFVIYPKDGFIVKSNNDIEAAAVEIKTENQTEHKKSLQASDNFEILFFNKDNNNSLGKLINRAQTQFLVLENNIDLNPSLFNLIKTNDNNNTYFLVNKENGYYLSCENFLNPQLCFIVEKNPGTEQILTKIKFVKISPTAENSGKTKNYLDEISSELATQEAKIREELANLDSQFRALTTEKQLQIFLSKLNSFKIKSDKELVKFDSEKIQPLLNDLNKEYNKIITQIDEKIKADRAAQRIKEEADRTAQRIKEEADRTAQRIKEETERIANQARNVFSRWGF
ncbi:hypothetical protein ACWNT8_11950 [Pigmentibacter ruber]|uniref:hypothetical protein n=1 Tax=Pigmentibacter ruber TaxID=2683196 RepID=UPI00131D5F4F|nr:hypothetical protein [Pigmentibacter ruber]BFD31985.1 hypothetical protein GTC16762_16030 [Pigmentibacter ruber]